MTRFPLLLAFLAVFCIGHADAGLTYQLSVGGSDSASESDLAGGYSYGPTTLSTTTQTQLSLQDASSVPAPFLQETADFSAGATPGALHASASAFATTENISESGPTSQSAAAAQASALDTVYFGPQTGGVSPTGAEVQAFQNLVGSVVVQWSIDGMLVLSSKNAGEAPLVSNSVSYDISLSGNDITAGQSAFVGISNFLDSDTSPAQSGTLQAPFSQFDSVTGIGSSTINQSLGVQAATYVQGGGVGSPFDDMAEAVADFQNTAQIVGIGLEDTNGTIISPSDYTFSSASGFDYTLLTPSAVVPEPSSWIMLVIGLVSPAILRRRTRQSA